MQSSLWYVIMGHQQSEPEKEISMTEYNIPNTLVNKVKVRQAVAQFMVERVLDRDTIYELAMDHLEAMYKDAGHTIGDLAAMVKETEIPSQLNYDGTQGPSQPSNMLCFGSFHNEEPEHQYYFFTKEQDYEYMACEVKGAE